MSTHPRIGVLGIGNVLMGDDGIGPFVVKILEARYEFPGNVVLHDLGTPGLGIASFFADYDIVILIDAVSAKAAPGEAKEVKSVVVPVISAVLAELHRLHASPQARADAAIPSIWWEEKVVSERVPGEALDVPGYTR